MNLHGRRRLALLAGCAALAAGMMAAGSPAAAAPATHLAFPVINQNAAVSWGDHALGDESIYRRDLFGPVAGLGGGVVQVAAGDAHGLAVLSGGTVVAWGWNTYGQLGDGTLVDRSAPVPVAGLTGVRQVAAGGGHSLALRSDGTVWAWGENLNGEVGNGTVTLSQTVPVEVNGLTGITKIAAGYGFSLALRSDGTVWAWGVNNSGQLGSGSTADSPVPVRVFGLSQVTSISAGWDASLAVRTTGIIAATSLWAWGANNHGQLGDGTTDAHYIPEQVTGFTVPDIAGICAGGQFAVVLGTDGEVWGWGYDWLSELGNAPTNAPVTRPLRILGIGSLVTQVSAGGEHVLALRSDGTVLAWGDDSFGELGNGTRTVIGGLPPVQVAGLSGVSQVAAGDEFSLAVHVPPVVAA